MFNPPDGFHAGTGANDISRRERFGQVTAHLRRIPDETRRNISQLLRTSRVCAELID
jgi:hypothetical protein